MQAFVFLCCLGTLAMTVLSRSTQPDSASENGLSRKDDFGEMELMNDVHNGAKVSESRFHLGQNDNGDDDDHDDNGIENMVNVRDSGSLMDKRRLRFHKRQLPLAAKRRLRFHKRQSPLATKRRLRFHSGFTPFDQRSRRTDPRLQARAPRLRFVKKQALPFEGFDFVEDKYDPMEYFPYGLFQHYFESPHFLETMNKLSQPEKDDDYLLDDEDEGYPLGFSLGKQQLQSKRSNWNFMDRETRAPRLRFHRRGATQSFLQKRSVPDISQNSPNLRKRRSIENIEAVSLSGISKRGARRSLSINNALVLLADKVIKEMQQEDNHRKQRLLQRLREVGKRSVEVADNDANENQDGIELVQMFASLLE